MREIQSRPTLCPTCAGTRISVPYRADSVMYLACADCCSVWAVDTRPTESAHDRRSRRQKSLQDTDAE